MDVRPLSRRIRVDVLILSYPGKLQQQCGLARCRIECCAHDDALAHWHCNDLPAGMNTGTLAQGSKRHMEHCHAFNAVPIRLPR